MNGQLAVQEQKKGTFLPASTFSQHAAVRPSADHTVQPEPAGTLIQSRFGQDFSQVAVHSESDTTRSEFAPPCPVTPTRCPFGGACHTCPVRVQAKLSLNQPGDDHEQEADRVAAQVMHLPLAKASSDGASHALQRKCIACETGQELRPGCAEEEERAQRMLIPTDMVSALEGGILAEEPVPMKGEPKEPLGEKKAEKKKEPAKKCPTQTVTMGRARCGASYGAIGRYCYSGARGWWFKENVVMGSPNTCDPGTSISQTATPFQTSGNCIEDRIYNINGPPSKVAPCKMVTTQTIFTGPTKGTVEQCEYNNEQIIEVTVTKKDAKGNPTAGKVITSSAGVPTKCSWRV